MGRLKASLKKEKTFIDLADRAPIPFVNLKPFLKCLADVCISKQSNKLMPVTTWTALLRGGHFFFKVAPHTVVTE